MPSSDQPCLSSIHKSEVTRAINLGATTGRRVPPSGLRPLVCRPVRIYSCQQRATAWFKDGLTRVRLGCSLRSALTQRFSCTCTSCNRCYMQVSCRTAAEPHSPVSHPAAFTRHRERPWIVWGSPRAVEPRVFSRSCCLASSVAGRDVRSR
jgi:hypothetical protein